MTVRGAEFLNGRGPVKGLSHLRARRVAEEFPYEWAFPGNAWGRYGPQDGFGDGWWAGAWGQVLDRLQQPEPTPAGMMTEGEWRQHLLWSRDLCDRNSLALGFLGHIANFVGDMEVQFSLKGLAPGPIPLGQEQPNPAVAAVQGAWEEFDLSSGWADWRQAECRRRAFRDGECLLRFFRGEYGSVPQVRHVEPEVVRTPLGGDPNGPWGWGKRVDDDDPERVVAYWLADPATKGETGEVVDASRVVALKLNTDRTVKRGVSDFYPVADGLRVVGGMLGNMGVVAKALSAIAWVEEHAPGTTEEAVQRLIGKVKDGDTYKLPSLPLVGGSPAVTTQAAEKLSPGTVRHTNAGRKIGSMPIVNAAALIAVEQAILRSVGVRWGAAEYFSGDASNNSFSSSLVAGGPFVRATEGRQREVAGFVRGVVNAVLRLSVESGRLSQADVDAVKVEVFPPAVVVVDRLADVQRLQVLVEKLGLDEPSALQEAGYDPRQVLANKKAWQAAGGSPPPPAAPGGPPGGGPRQSGDGGAVPVLAGEAVDSSGHRHKGHGPGGGQFTGGGGGGGGGDGGGDAPARNPKSAGERKMLGRGLQDGLADVVRTHAARTGKDFESAFHALMADPAFRSAHNRLVAARAMVEAGTGFERGVRTRKLSDEAYARAYKSGVDALGVMRSVAAGHAAGHAAASESTDASGHRHKGSGAGGGQFTGGGGGGESAAGGGSHAGGSAAAAGFASFKTGAAAERELAPSAAQWAEDPSDYFSNRAVKAYVGTSDSFRINDCLRSDCGDATLRAKADALAGVLGRCSFPKAVGVSRAVTAKTPAERDALLGKFRANVGGTFTDPAFVSTTANPRYADEWAAKVGAAGTSLSVTVLVPAGAKAAYVPKAVAGRQEWEVLIQRGGTYKVRSVEGDHVTLELTGHE